MQWEEYYDRLGDWAASTAVSRMSQLESFGPAEEVIDAINIIAFDHEKGAVRLLKKALAAGVRFSGEQLSELCLICDKETLEQAVLQCADRFTAADLDALDCICDEDLLTDIARKRRIPLPESLRDYAETMCFEAEEEETLSTEELSAEYDYILDCLYRSHEHLKNAYQFAAIAASSGDRASTVVKYHYLYNAQEPLAQAMNAWDRLDPRYKGTVSLKDIWPRIGNRTMWQNYFFGNVFTNMMVRRRIRVVMEKVAGAYNAVLRLRKTL